MVHTTCATMKRLYRSLTLLIILLGLALLLAWSAPASAAQAPNPPRCDWSDQNYDDFYLPPDLGELTPERLGEVLRVEHIQSFTPEEVASAAGLPVSPYGAEAYRILYLSQAPLGVPQAVSALIIVPTGTAPAEGFPVIVHGHPTVGLADVCAPSRTDLSPQGFLPWPARGYIISATDYTGLGTPGLHPYTVGEVAAFSMLDSARSALKFCDEAYDLILPASNQIILQGHSQGGQAALFAHQEWSSYASELNVLGVVTFAPGSELRFLAERMANSQFSGLVMPTALAIYAYDEYYGMADPLQRWLQEPYATDLPDQAENRCIVGVGLWMGFNPDAVFQPDMLAAVREDRWDDLQPLADFMEINTPGNYTSDVPVLILQGGRDVVMPVEANRRLMQRLCDHGTPTQFSLYPNAGHGVPRVARGESLQWIADRLAGRPLSTNTCNAP